MTSLKRCYFCKKYKDFSEFGKDKSKVRSLNSRCKICANKIATAYYHNNKKRVLNRQASYMRNYSKTHKGKEAIKDASKRAWHKHRDKWLARAKLRHAVKKGEIIKEACYCGETKTQGHHKDYSQPLVAIWLCSRHHADLHNNIRYLESYYKS